MRMTFQKYYQLNVGAVERFDGMEAGRNKNLETYKYLFHGNRETSLLLFRDMGVRQLIKKNNWRNRTDIAMCENQDVMSAPST